MLPILILVIIVLTLLLLYRNSDAHNCLKKMGVNHRPPKFLFGDMSGIFFGNKSLTDILSDVYNAFPDTRYTGMYSFTTPTIVIKDLELIKRIAVKDFEHFTDHRPFVDEEADPFWGRCLFALTGNKWRDMRSTLSQVYTSTKMKRIFHLMQECAEELITHLENNEEKRNMMDMKELFSRCATDIIASTAFGIKNDSINEKENIFYKMGKDLVSFNNKFLRIIAYLIAPGLCKKFGIKFIQPYLAKFFTDILINNIRQRKQQLIKREDIVNILIETQKERLKYEETDSVDSGFVPIKERFHDYMKGNKVSITDEDIVSQGMLFFFAGSETTAVSLTFMAYELATNPEIQKKLQREIDQTLKKYNGNISYDMLTTMKYLDMVVTETLRKWPPVIAIDRICSKEYTISPVHQNEKQVFIEKGFVIWLPIFPLHRNPKFYPNPERFDPERFNDDNKSKILPYPFMPFSCGPRYCIGSKFAFLEIKILFVNLLSKFTLTTMEKTTIPPILGNKHITLCTKTPIYLKIIPRHSK